MSRILGGLYFPLTCRNVDVSDSCRLVDDAEMYAGLIAKTEKKVIEKIPSQVPKVISKKSPMITAKKN